MSHVWQAHGDIRICERCGITRHVEHMADLPVCDSTEMDATKARIHTVFLRKLAAEFPEHPWVKKEQP